MVTLRLQGEPIWNGDAQGMGLVLDEPLSWWGGIDPETGTVIDRSHPQCGACTTGRILVLPGGRGSSGGSAVLAESIRLRTGPAGVVLRTIDPILVVGAMVAAELYPRRRCPVVVVEHGYDLLSGHAPIRIHSDGLVEQVLPDSEPHV